MSLRLPSPRSTTFSTLKTAQAMCHNQHLRHNWKRASFGKHAAHEHLVLSFQCKLGGTAFTART